MFTLSLYDKSDPPRLIESRAAGETVMRLGRDPSSDWVIEDAERTISRHHVEVRVSGSALFLRPVGKNDVYMGDPPTRIARGSSTEIRAGDRVLLGPFLLGVESDVGLSQPHFDPKSDSSEDRSLDCSLLDAFCEGAQMDASQFISDDPAKILKEVGAVYRQAVLGLSQLLRQRSAIRAEILADRTVVGSRENNLIKWAPSHRLMVDLLTNHQEGFLAGADAVESSFHDLDTHIESLLAGHRSALQAVLDSIRPSLLASRTPRGILRDPAADCWTAFKDAYADLERGVDGNSNGALHHGFAHGYEKAAQARRA